MELRKELESSTNSLEGYCSTIELPQQFIKVEILQKTENGSVIISSYQKRSKSIVHHTIIIFVPHRPGF